MNHWLKKQGLEDNQVNIILFGPPGAGKGTQSEALAKDFSLFQISTGDLLREEIKKRSDLGNKIKSIIDKGMLVSDQTINNLIENILSNKKFDNRLIFDGYPRNINQAKDLDKLIKKYKQKIASVLSLNVDKSVITKRILGRQVCSNCGLTFNEFFKPANIKEHDCDPKFLQKRTDDNEKTIVSRLETYTKETLPILNYYKNQNLLYEVDGMGDIDEIYSKISQIIRSLDTWLYNVY